MAEAEKALRQLNEATGQAFANSLAQLSFTAEQQHRYGSQCLNIAGSGWHAWESAQSYINVTSSVAAELGTVELLSRGDYGESLCGYSFEPSQAYFEGLPDLLQTRQPMQAIVLVEATGNKVRETFPHASNLIADFFRTAASLATNLPEGELASWTDVLTRVLPEGRQETLDYLKLSQGQIPWQVVQALYAEGPVSALQFVRIYPELAAKHGAQPLMEWTTLLMHFARRVDDLSPLLTVLSLASREQIASRSLRELLWLFEDIRLAAAVVAHQEELPLLLNTGVRQWIDNGLQLPGYDARYAHFNLESRGSVAFLENLKGQVNFTDVKRVLQLYAEAMAGARIKVKEAEEDSNWVAFDGLNLHLPATVQRFSERPDNFLFYRVAIMHQLGFQEFGFFSQPITVRRFLAAFEAKPVADLLFSLVEAARIDWQLVAKYPGMGAAVKLLKSEALQSRTGTCRDPMEAVVRSSLDATAAELGSFAEINTWLRPVAAPGAMLNDTLQVVAQLYEVVTVVDDLRVPAPVDYRGQFALHDAIGHAISLEAMETLDVTDADDLVDLLTQFDPKDAEIEELKDGDVDPRLGKLVTELEKNIPLAEDMEPEERDELVKTALEAMAGKVGRQGREDRRYFYDEWDHAIDDYRQRWCTLKEIRQIEEVPEYVTDTLNDHLDTARQVRRQLNMLKPELLRKVKGVIDGDELDIERTVEAVVDRRSGTTPDEAIYVQRQRKDRDVSTMFLLDMSASTDDTIADPNAPPVTFDEDDDDYLAAYWERKADEPEADRIIDLEKQAVILMAEALEELGDAYSVCGFSGYGREDVEYYLCKDFDEPYDRRARGRIGGIKPCRSTRMGPAIRHATRRLVQTESRIKALIIISDGYPQDFDYGKDRSSKEYGVKDTMKALSEARQQGVQSFCLTVDPSGHDYLREMCPDKQYMVIQDIKSLPNELSKVYQSLTG